MDNKYIVSVVSIVVAIIVLAGVLMPVIDMSSGGETTIHITNEDASTLTLQKATSGFALDLSVTTDDGDLVIANGSDTMTVDPNESFFIVATDSAAIYHDQGDTICVWTADGVTQTRELTAPFTAVIADNKLTVDDGTSTDLPLPSSYMFSPSSTGGYGSFIAPDLNLVPNDPVVTAGSFVGIYCYNENTTAGDALQEYVTVSDDVLSEVIWGRPAVEEQQIIIQPLDPSIIGPFDPSIGGGSTIQPFDPDENVIMAVPTPTYSDGDWGYDLTTVDGVTKAVIVSYSGAGGGAITVPATIGGYDVYQVGKNGNANNVFPTSGFSATDLIISEGIVVLNQAIRSVPGFTGSLKLPSTLENIESYAAYQSKIDGSLIIPESVQTIGASAFGNITTLDYLVILGEPNMDSYAFRFSTGISIVFNLGDLEISSGDYGLPADAEIIQGDDAYIEASLYLAPVDVTVTEGVPSPYAPILSMIPLFIVIAILMVAVGFVMVKRNV